MILEGCRWGGFQLRPASAPSFSARFALARTQTHATPVQGVLGNAVQHATQERQLGVLGCSAACRHLLNLTSLMVFVL